MEPAPPVPFAPDSDVWTAPTPVPVDPGTLPQTEDRPLADDPRLIARLEGLLTAIDAGDPSPGHPAFFPKSAYVALKALPPPARADRDYDERLLAAYDRDLRRLHDAGPAGRFVRLEVPERGVRWIVPGKEYNTIGYWRVLGATLVREIDGAEVPLRITSMISWRGQWYVVHLAAME